MRQIPIKNSTLVEDRKGTFLNAIVEAGKNTISVESIFGFAVNQILLIGEIGNEKSEIVATHNSTAPTDSTITLASNLKFNHPQGTKVYILDWDTAEISWAGEEDSTKHILNTIPIQPDRVETLYEDTTKVDGYYFVRFINSVLNRYSDYSAPVPWEGFEDNTVASVINYALKRNGLKKFTQFIDHEFCVDEINNCLRFIVGKKKKWTHLQEFDYLVGSTDRGINSLELPYNVWRMSNRAILDVRIGNNISLTYKDKREFNDLMVGVAKTETAAASMIGDNEVLIKNTKNLKPSGAVMINGEVIEYGGKDDNLGKLTGLTITKSIPADSTVWQGSYLEGNPRYYTVYDNRLFWYPLTSPANPIQSVIADFWTEAPLVEHDNDKIDIYRYDMVKYWLVWAIRSEIKNDGIRDRNDGDYLDFREILMDAIRTDVTGQRYKTRPKLNKINYM